MRRVILNLHGLGTPGPDIPEDEKPYWIAPALLETAVERADALKQQVEVLFTFDDGNLSDLEIGAPILTNAGHSATFFVLSGRIGTPDYLSGADIRALGAMGHRIGSHGADHVDWTGLDQAGFTRELVDARHQIEKETGHPVTEAAIPFGRYNARVLKALRAAGFVQVYSSDGGAIGARSWPVPRTSMTCDMSASQIDDILLGREPLKRTLRRWLAVAVKSRT